MPRLLPFRKMAEKADDLEAIKDDLEAIKKAADGAAAVGGRSAVDQPAFLSG